MYHPPRATNSPHHIQMNATSVLQARTRSMITIQRNVTMPIIARARSTISATRRSAQGCMRAVKHPFLTIAWRFHRLKLLRHSQPYFMLRRRAPHPHFIQSASVVCKGDRAHTSGGRGVTTTPQLSLTRWITSA